MMYEGAWFAITCSHHSECKLYTVKSQLFSCVVKRLNFGCIMPQPGKDIITSYNGFVTIPLRYFQMYDVPLHGFDPELYALTYVSSNLIAKDNFKSYSLV